jgi:ubiquitin C-terminal hydrolase
LGIVGFIGNKITDIKRTVRHYIAYIRSKNEWELHDDLQKKTRKVSEQKYITPHILVYIQPFVNYT